MLNDSNEVTFVCHSGEYTRAIDVMYIKFGFEPIGGKIEENIDLELEENYQNYRITIETRFWATPSDSDWLMNTLLPSNDKQLIIDSITYDVILADRKVLFDHVKKNNFMADVKLKFKKKEPGN